jgi:hypothetical protein
MSRFWTVARAGHFIPVTICALLGSGIGTNAFAQNQWYFIDFELSQGVIFADGVDPYTLSAHLHPTIGFGGKENERKNLEYDLH